MRNSRRTSRPLAPPCADLPAHGPANAKPCAELAPRSSVADATNSRDIVMNSIIWLVGAVVIVLIILSFFGLR